MPAEHPPRLTRRALLAALVAGAAGCTVREVPRDQTAPGPSPTATGGSGSPSPAATSKPDDEPTSEATEAAELYEPIAEDVYPNAKRLAGRFAQLLATYEPGTSPRQIVRAAARQRSDDFDVQAVARTARPVLRRGARSTAEVVYAQLGGLDPHDGDPTSASVMVVVRQRLESDDGRTEVTRVMDVRLVNAGNQWQLETLADAGGTPVPRPDSLPPIAEKVLDDRRIDLPDSARWDIHAGIIDRRLLQTMHGIAELFPYRVAVLKSGHPVHVFGSRPPLVSGHTEGRGCDIWSIGGAPVVQQRPDEVGVEESRDTDAYAFTERLLTGENVPELGSPWDLDGPSTPGRRSASFTDPVHADHIHVAFKAL